MIEQGRSVPVAETIRRGLNRVAEPAVVFPVIAILLLTAIWASTLGLIKLKRSDAAHAASVSSRELLGTYDAQVSRALHEIDQTMNLVKYWHENDRKHRSLVELRDKGLLPPDLLFSVRIVNRQGTITDSTRGVPGQGVANEDYFRKQLGSDIFFIGQPAQNPAIDGNLYFSRRVNAADGAFDGVVVVSVDAAFFVSGYETSKLGAHGVLAIAGTDGIVRIRRTGETELSGNAIDYASVIADPAQSIGTSRFRPAAGTGNSDGPALARPTVFPLQ